MVKPNEKSTNSPNVHENSLLKVISKRHKMCESGKF